jgi:hypothetical protein
VNVEITARKLAGTVLVLTAIMIIIYVVVSALFLLTSFSQPLKVEVQNPGYGMDVSLGILLQIGLFGVLVGAGSVLGNFGIKLIRD